MESNAPGLENWIYLSLFIYLVYLLVKEAGIKNGLIDE